MRQFAAQRKFEIVIFFKILCNFDLAVNHTINFIDILGNIGNANSCMLEVLRMRHAYRKCVLSSRTHVRLCVSALVWRVASVRITYM